MSSALDQAISTAKTLLAQCIVAANKAAAAAASVSGFGYAPLDSPNFVGTPTAPTPPSADISTRLATTAWLAQKMGQPNGVATLGLTGIIPVGQLPFSGITNDGSWDANANSPTLTSSSGTAGHFFVVSVAGTTTLNGISSWNIGDWALFSGSIWQKIPVPVPAPGAVPLSSIEGMAPYTVVSNNTTGTASPTAVAISALTSHLSNMVGDTGAGGSAGLVPAPAAGDALAGKFLKADGTFAVPPNPNLTAYALLNSPAFVGTPTAPTPSRAVNSTAIATAAYVIAQLASATEMLPVVDGTASCGTSTYGARIDHIHGTDFSRAGLNSPAFAGTPTAPTAARATNTTQLATLAFVLAQLASATEMVPVVDGTASCGTSTYGARIDHIHPTDTSRASLTSPAFGGAPTAPTAAPGTNTTQLATTAFVEAAVAGVSVAAGNGITVAGSTVSIDTNDAGGIGSYALILCRASGGVSPPGVGAAFTSNGDVLNYAFSTTSGVNLGSAVPTGQVWRNMTGAAAGGDVYLCKRVS